MSVALRAGALYAAIVFAVGFVLGVVRVVWLTPALGPLAAVSIEAPVMLAMSWVVCAWIVGRLAVAGASGVRLAMGALAFVLLMAMEYALAFALQGQAPGAAFFLYDDAHEIVGLLAQITFAAIPWLQARL